MKKILSCICLLALLCSSLLLGAFADETIDTSSLTTVYENAFDNADALADFTQYRGSTWEVKDGRLYLTAAENDHAFILYTGDSKLMTMADYVLDVDMYNVQTQAGAIVRSESEYVNPDTNNGFAGYIGFVSFDGTKGAIGYGKNDGAWGGNIMVAPEAVTAPGSDIHLQVAVKGSLVQCTISDLATGNVLWTHTATREDHPAGSFGFRFYAVEKNGLLNVNNTSLDNLKISKFAESEKPVTPDDSKFKATRTYQNQFTDVAESQWFHPFVKTAYEYALANGTSDTKFSPDGQFTVAQALTAAANIHTAYSGKTVRAAAAGEQWYTPYVEYCIENGIIKDGQFTNYDANIKRGDMAIVFANILPESEYAAIREKTLPDMTADMASAAAVQKLANAGIVGGDTKGNFNPDNEITRAEACVIFTRIAVADMRDAK